MTLPPACCCRLRPLAAAPAPLDCRCTTTQVSLRAGLRRVPVPARPPNFPSAIEAAACCCPQMKPYPPLPDPSHGCHCLQRATFTGSEASGPSRRPLSGQITPVSSCRFSKEAACNGQDGGWFVGALASCHVSGRLVRRQTKLPQVCRRSPLTPLPCLCRLPGPGVCSAGADHCCPRASWPAELLSRSSTRSLQRTACHQAAAPARAACRQQ